MPGPKLPDDTGVSTRPHMGSFMSSERFRVASFDRAFNDDSGGHIFPKCDQQFARQRHYRGFT